MIDELNGGGWLLFQCTHSKEKSSGDPKTLEDYLNDVIEKPAHTLEVGVSQLP